MSEPSNLQLQVNGKPVQVPDSYTVKSLLTMLKVSGRLAVEVNGEIVPRSFHAEHALSNGDRIEVIHAIGGG